jgi:hypothetical protein
VPLLNDRSGMSWSWLCLYCLCPTWHLAVQRPCRPGTNGTGVMTGPVADHLLVIMIERDVWHMPVVEGRRPLDMISARDLLSLSAWPLLRGIADRA